MCAFSSSGVGRIGRVLVHVQLDPPAGSSPGEPCRLLAHFGHPGMFDICYERSVNVNKLIWRCAFVESVLIRRKISRIRGLCGCAESVAVQTARGRTVLQRGRCIDWRRIGDCDGH